MSGYVPFIWSTGGVAALWVMAIRITTSRSVLCQYTGFADELFLFAGCCSVPPAIDVICRTRSWGRGCVRSAIVVWRCTTRAQHDTYDDDYACTAVLLYCAAVARSS